jgi:hypothetical protein
MGLGRYNRVVHCVEGDLGSVLPFPILAAPTRVSPAPATEQKQHHKNNQYGFHCRTSLVRGSWTYLCNGHLISSLKPYGISGEDVRLSTLDHFKRSIRTVRHPGLCVDSLCDSQEVSAGTLSCRHFPHLDRYDCC